VIILALCWVAIAEAVTYDAILEWNGPYYRSINSPTQDQLVNDPAIDIPFVQPAAVAAMSHNNRDVIYVADSGHNRIQVFEVNATYIYDTAFVWDAAIDAHLDFDDNEIALVGWGAGATRWVVPHSEVVVIDGVRWTWVASLTGFTAADKVYTIDYDLGVNAPVITLPDNSLTSASVISVRYLAMDDQTAAANAFGLGDVDYGIGHADPPVLTKIDESISGAPSSWQAVRALSVIANEVTATSDDLFVLDAADNSVDQNEELFNYIVAVDGSIADGESYDDVLTNPYDLCVAEGGTDLQAAVTLPGGGGGVVTTATVVDDSQVTGHSYTLTEAGGLVTVTDITTGKVLVNAAAIADMADPYLGIPGISVDFDAGGNGAYTFHTTKGVPDRYVFVTDTGADRIKVISADDEARTAVDDWLPGDAHTLANQPAAAGQIGLTADVDYRITTPASPGQDYSTWTNASPIKQGTLETITSDPDGTPLTWTRVDDIATAGPADRVYEVDWRSGQITFGDGAHGAVAPGNTVLTYSYSTTPDRLRYGATGNGPGRFAAPRGLAARWNAVTGAFDVYVADTGNNRIQKLAFYPEDAANNLPAHMEFVCQWNTASSVSDFLNAPVDVVVAVDGANPSVVHVAVADQGNDRIVIYNDTGAKTGTAAIPAWDASLGGQGNNLGLHMGINQLCWLANGNDLDLYAADLVRGKITKYEEAPTPSIAITNFTATGTCYPPTSSYSFTISSANLPADGTIDFYFDTASTFNVGTARLCMPEGTVSATATSATWNFAETPGGAPADGAAYYIYVRAKDANKVTIASDQTTSSELLCIDSQLLPGLRGVDAIDNDFTLYLQNGLTRTIDLQVAYPESIVAVGFAGAYTPSEITVQGITAGNGWDVPDNDYITELFNQAYDNETGSYLINTSVLNTKVGLVTAGPHTLAKVTVKAGDAVITPSDRFKAGTFTITTAGSGMKDIHNESPAQWTTRNVNLRFGYLGDFATDGTGADSTLPNLAPNPDGKINFEDQMTFTLAWNGVANVQDRIADIGPTTGTAPDLLPVPDGVFDVEDILAFTVMHSWAAGQGYYRTAPGTEPQMAGGLEPRPAPLGGPVEGATRVYTVSHLQNPAEGEMVTVDFNVDDASDLSGACLNLGFNPAQLELVKVENGGFLDGSNGSMFLQRSGHGWLEISTTRLDREQPSVSGSGTIAHATFRILDEAAADLDLTYDLRNSSGKVLSRGGSQMAPFSGTPASFELYAARPNPVKDMTNIVYALPGTANVNLSIFDVSGRQVRTLASGCQAPGYHVVSFDGRSESGQLLPAGVYFYNLQADDQQSTRKLIIAR